MSNGRAVLIGSLLAAALAAGCGGSASKRPTGSDGGGGDEETGGRNGGGGFPGTGGKVGGTGGFGGAGGSMSTGGSSGADAGGFFPDAGASGGAGGGGPADAGVGDAPTGPLPPPPMPVACEVSIRAVRPTSFDGLPAGPSSRLRVEALATGTSPPAMPDWKWEVRDQFNANVPTTPVDMEPDQIEFGLATAGSYSIKATAAPGCTKTVFAFATDNPTNRYWLRVIPPTSADQPLEGFPVYVPRQGKDQDLTLGSGTLVSIDPRDAADDQRAVFSYVRITSPGSTLRVEGHTRTGALTARLDPLTTYEVLVVPDGALAPLLFRGRPSDIAQNLFVVDAGIGVGGHVSSSKGMVAGARVILRDGPVPSTTGLAQTAGQYDLRVRSGNRFAAVVIPPPHAGLPEARLAAGSGLAIYDFPPGARVLDFAWSAVETATLELAVADSAGAPVKAPVRVRLASAADAFPDVGTLTLKVLSTGQPDQSFEYHPTGFFQQEGTSDARGFIAFTDLPRGKYSATLTPSDGSAAITTVDVDVGSARVTLSPRLARKISLSGKLLPEEMTSAATVLALDPEADPALPPPSAVVDGTGKYILYLDPGRRYSLVLEAQPTKSLPRTFLRSLEAPASDTVQETVTIPGGVPLAGRVMGASGPVAGALVEAYCVGAPPSCIDVAAPDTTSVRPTAEALSDGSGNYRLLVPDPAIGL